MRIKAASLIFEKQITAGLWSKDRRLKTYCLFLCIRKTVNVVIILE